MRLLVISSVNNTQRKMSLINIITFILIFIINTGISNLTNSVTYQDSDKIKYIQLQNSNRFKIEFNKELEYNKISFYCDIPNRDCAGHGTCTSDGTDCECEGGYYSFPNSFMRCTYKQKSKFLAILLELLFPFGFGHLYVLNYSLFLAKFLVYFFSYYYVFCLMIFIGSVNNSNVNSDSYDYSKKICCVLLPIIFIWYIFDVVWFALGGYSDGNSVDLY